MPKLKKVDGTNHDSTIIEYIWIEIPCVSDNIHKLEPFMVNGKVADYIESLEDIIKGYEKILNLK